MKLQRLKVTSLRQFREPVEIADLADELNLFTGPNESGKSTLVRAIRAAFFERHKSSSVDDLQPWGDTSVSPLVELDFIAQGKTWRLAKSFLKQKRCDLEVDGEKFSGDDAEDKLSELLGYQLPARGASKPEHWGIPGLLWIEQGAGQEVRGCVENASDHLQSALGEMVGNVASSSGDWIIERVAAARAELLTKKGKPTNEFAAAGQALRELDREIEALTETIAGYQTEVDRLGELRLQQQQDDECPWQPYRQRQQQAQQDLEAIAALIDRNQQEQEARHRAEELSEILQQRLDEFDAARAMLTERRLDVQQKQQQFEQIANQSAALAAAQASARDQFTQAEQRLQAARMEQHRQELQHSLDNLQPKQAELRRRLEEASAVRQRLSELRQRLQGMAIDPDQLQQLEALNRDLEKLNLRQQNIATRLQYDLAPDRKVQFNGEPAQGAGELLLLQPTRLDIDGVGSFTIQPGGEDLEDLLRDQQSARREIRQLQQLMGVDTIDEARDRAANAQSLQHEIRVEIARYESISPEGVDVIRESLEQLEGTSTQLEEKLALLPPADPALTVPSMADAEHEHEQARQTLHDAERRHSGHSSDLRLAQQALTTAQNEVKKLQEQTQSAATQQGELKIRDQIQDQKNQILRLEKDIAERSAQIDAAQPEQLQADIERLGKAAENLEIQAANRRQEIDRLQTRLETLGAQGLEEQLAGKQVEREQCHRRLEELRRRAEALDMLLALLNSKRQDLTRRLQEPLQKHIQHYLNLLFPGAELTVSDNLVPQQLVRQKSRGAEYSDIDALSFGAREQMGLISRLAYADLLQEAGRPTLIILDDALVHSDRQRLEQMKRVLFDASRRHQIFLFTCHPENWHELGVPREMRSLLLNKN